jgi:hypothetical protein
LAKIASDPLQAGKEILVPFPADAMKAWPISPRVNRLGKEPLAPQTVPESFPRHGADRCGTMGASALTTPWKTFFQFS